jgi:beta-lactamase regulating signal transducer with metallopeptidase domain
VDSLLYVGLSNAAAALALAIPVAVIGRLCRRPALVHSLWLLVLLKLVTPPLHYIVLPWALAEDKRSIQSNDDTQVKQEKDESTAREYIPVESVPFPTSGDANTEVSPTDRTDTEAGSLATPPLRVSMPAWTTVIAVVWVLGSVVCAVIAVRRLWSFHRLLTHAVHAPAQLQERADVLAGRLGIAAAPVVGLIPGRVSPLLWALLGPPRVLLPTGLWSRLSPAQRDTLLLHELAHLRRRDHWVRRLELLVTLLYWWHPVVWLARHELQEAEEQCCDAWVVAVLPAQAEAYAEALLETLRYLSRFRSAVPLGASGIGRVHCLKRRLLMILDGTTPRQLSRVGSGTVLTLAAVLLPLLPAWGQVPVEPAASPPVAPPAVAAPTPPQDDTNADQLREARSAVFKLSADLQEMRQRMQQLERRLRRAQDRVRTLEGGAAPSALPSVAEPLAPRHAPRGNAPAAPPPYSPSPVPPGAVSTPPPVSVDAAPLPAPAAPALVAPPPSADQPRFATPAIPGSPGQPPTHMRPAEQRDYERRLRALENKLDRLLREMESMRRQQPATAPDTAPSPLSRTPDLNRLFFQQQPTPDTAPSPAAISRP